MRKKFTIAIVEVLGFNMLAVYLVVKLYLDPTMKEQGVTKALTVAHDSFWIFIAVYIVGMIVISLHIYFSIIKPSMDYHSQLEKAAEESRSAENMRREFVANVSHELKTPLTSISGFIETLQAGAADDPEIRSKFIDIIAIETSRLERLIEDLLVISDIENRREALEQNEIYLMESLRGIVAFLQPIADSKKIDLYLKGDEDVKIYGSSDRFRQMMVNIVENAIKYSNDGSRVWITAEKKEHQIIIVVKDEGIGIKEEHLDRLFERFYRVDKSRSKKAGGTGLGLSIVKHIAYLFGAELKVDSTYGEGTSFYVIFER